MYKQPPPTKTVVVPNFSAISAGAAYPLGGASVPKTPYTPKPSSGGGGGYFGSGSRQDKSQYWRQNARASDFAPSRFYCETCCVDCVGKGSFEAHLVGQQHQKKLKLAASASSSTSGGGGAKAAGASRPAENFCEICNCACTNGDAFMAHLRGQKHQKAVKLWIKLGKALPESLKPQQVKVIPRTNFTTGGTLNTLTGKVENAPSSSSAGASSSTVAAPAYKAPAVTVVPVNKKAAFQQTPIDVAAAPVRDDKPIVGPECIIEERSAEGKVINYKCNICNCDMNNAFMRDDHLKGRKHLTEYKLKVNPNLKVTDKKLAQSFSHIERLQQQAEMEELRKRDLREQSARIRTANREHELLAMFPGTVQTSALLSPDDHLIMRKHADIDPDDDEILAVDTFVSQIESALKMVADSLSEARPDKLKEMKGVMRVGAFAKGIMLKGETNFDLVVLCDRKPSETLLQSICATLCQKLPEVVKDHRFDVNFSARKATISVKSVPQEKPMSENTNSEAASASISAQSDPIFAKYSVTIHVTSPAIRDDVPSSSDPHDLLDRKACGSSLAETRRAKWFDSKSKRNNALSVIVRILRDLCRRIPTWNSFPCYVLELLCDKALRTVAHEMGPAELLRRFFEIVASGILLPGDSGVYDPCEKGNQNAAKDIKLQDCQDITTSSQHALRLMALEQTDKILGTISTPDPSTAASPGDKRKTPPDDRSSSQPPAKSAPPPLKQMLPPQAKPAAASHAPATPLRIIPRSGNESNKPVVSRPPLPPLKPVQQIKSDVGTS